MEGITIAQLTTVGGIGIVAALLDQVFWQTAGASGDTKSRFGPLVAIVTGVILGVAAGVLLSQTASDLAQSALNGVLGGLTAIGLYDVTTSKAGLG